MEAGATHPPNPPVGEMFRRIDLQAVAVWLLGFLLVVYLALNGGGYDPIVRDQLGILVWWVLLLGLAIGVLPAGRLRRGSLVALALLAAYVCWVGVSAGWSRSAESSIADLGRVVTYLGVFALALSIRGRRGARRMIGALGSAIALIAFIALLSRLHPAWFPNADETATLLPVARNRLAYPLDYWNGLAALLAIGLPLILHLATSARHLVTKVVAAATLPAIALTIFLTISRGGTLMAAVGLIVFLALAEDRVAKLATLVTGLGGGALLMVLAGQRDALSAGLTGPLARDQGNELLLITILVCVVVGLVQWALVRVLESNRRPAWSEPSRRVSLWLLSGSAALAVIAALALGGPGRASDAWHEFTEAKGTVAGSARLTSFSSNGRWPYWQSTLHENATAPLIGTGSGSFESWWAEHGKEGGFVRDAHSLYFETLGELGIVGLALIVGFLGWVLVAGMRRYLDAGGGSRTQLAAALAGCTAFCVGAASDWLWELAVVPIAFLLLASVLVGAGEQRRSKSLPVPARVAGVVVSLIAMVAIAIPLSSARSLQKSQNDAHAGSLDSALRAAHDAREVEPFAGRPRLQEALVLEAQGRLEEAGKAAVKATDLEPDEWRAWVIRSRLEAELGEARAAVESFHRAQALNPRSELLQE